MARPAAVPEARLLAALVRAGDAKSIKRVVAELKRQGGNMEATAKALLISPRTLYLWRDSVPELGALIADNARGRIGRPTDRRTKAPKSLS